MHWKIKEKRKRRRNKDKKTLKKDIKLCLNQATSVNPRNDRRDSSNFDLFVKSCMCSNPQNVSCGTSSLYDLTMKLILKQIKKKETIRLMSRSRHNRVVEFS